MGVKVPLRFTLELVYGNTSIRGSIVERKEKNRIIITWANKLSKFLRWSLLIFIIKGFRTIVFIFIVISGRTHGITVIGIGSLSFWGDNHLEVAGSILTTGE